MRRMPGFAAGVVVGIALILAVGFGSLVVQSQDEPPTFPLWLPLIQTAATPFPTPVTIQDGDYYGTTTTGGEFGFHVFNGGMLITWGWFDTDCNGDYHMKSDMGGVLASRDRTGAFSLPEGSNRIIDCTRLTSSSFDCSIGFAMPPCVEGIAHKQ